MRTPLFAVLLLVLPVLANAYSFTISNTSDSAITRIEVSEDGESWGDFDMGRSLMAGQSAEANWDESTDDSNCEWLFRATFADGSVSDEVAFDFCQEDLVIEFE